MQNSGCRAAADGDSFSLQNFLNQTSMRRGIRDAFQARFRACYSAIGLRGTIRRFLASPTATWVVIALAVALTVPSLTVGFSADDWLQVMIARGQHPIAG